MKLREFTLLEGDLLPALLFNATDGSGNPLDLTAATAVTFIMATRPGAIDEESENVINAVAVFVDKPTGQIKYQWQAGDTDARGKYIGVFEVSFSGAKLSLPNDDYLSIVVLARPVAV